MSPPAPPALRLTLTPAPAWAALIVVVHAAAALAALIWLPALGAAAVCLGLGLSAWRGASAAMLHGPHAVRAVSLGPDGAATYVDGHGEWRAASVGGAATIGPRFAVLRLRDGRDRRDLVLLPGSLRADELRRARTWIRWRLSGL